MSDAAAFFRQQKKKNKKAFTFNANLVDASTVNATVHVEAPALSNEHDIIVENQEMNENNSEWDEQAVVGTSNQFRNASDAVLDFKVSSGNGIDSDDIASKLRVQETKAQLAAAREGMEREALKLKEEREKKEKAKEEATKAVGGSGPAKWIAPSLRRQMGTGGDRPIMGGKLNVEDEELFPDLAAAGKILEQKEKETQALFKPAKKTPVGGGASWASKSNKKAEPVAEEVTEEKAPEPEVGSRQNETEAAEVPSQPTIPIVKKPVIKKKKKDLSTFKPSS